MLLVMLLNMFLTSQGTAVVSSTDLKRNYKGVQDLLKDNKIVIISNRNTEGEVDGIMISYSELAVEKIEDLLEELEMEQNREALKKELKASYQSAAKKTYKLSEL